MSLKFSQGVYKIKYPEKYIGQGAPRYRSSWEFTFMTFCDNNPSIQQWASESVKIPYRDPLTGKQTIYVPDFLISYVDRNMKKHVEIVEIKPANQTLKEKVGKNAYNQDIVVCFNTDAPNLPTAPPKTSGNSGRPRHRVEPASIEPPTPGGARLRRAASSPRWGETPSSRCPPHAKSCSSSRTTSTGHGACRTIFSVTLPSSTCLNPV